MFTELFSKVKIYFEMFEDMKSDLGIYRGKIIRLTDYFEISLDSCGRDLFLYLG
jgi:hypothetical protein